MLGLTGRKESERMLSLKTRLECPHSFATDEDTFLHCDYDGECDGKLHAACLWDMSFSEQMKVIAEDKRLKESE